MNPTWQHDGYRLFRGDTLDTLPTLPECSYDTLVTDPPAGIGFMGKTWDDKSRYIPRTERGQQVLDLLGGMLKAWEAGFLAFTVDWATLAFPLVKPGGAALVWALPRTSDLTQFGLRLAGWLVVDVVAFLFGSGFPKSLDMGKAIDRAAGAEREVVGPSSRHIGGKSWGPGRGAGDKVQTMDTAPATDAAQLWDGWGTALKPAREDWILCYRPRDGTYAENALTWGVAGLWIDGGRIETQDETRRKDGGWQKEYVGAGGYKSVNAFEYRPHQGRFPANVIHDGSEEVVGLFPVTGPSRPGSPRKGKSGNGWGITSTGAEYDDSGSAARFFYCAKASRSERNAGLEGMEEKPSQKMGDGLQSMVGHPSGNHGKTSSEDRRAQNNHPTVKPLALMRYLVRLTRTPTGGVVLDPFGGSGTTMLACIHERRRCDMIERDGDYCDIITARAEHTLDTLPPEQLELWE